MPIGSRRHALSWQGPYNLHGCPWISICMQQLGVFEFHYAFSLVSLIAEMICQGPMGFGTEFS